MSIGGRVGGGAINAVASAFFRGLARPAFAKYTGHSIEPQRFAKAA